MWIATSAKPQTLVADAPITITFAKGQVSGNAGCNHFGGAYSVSGGLLKAPQIGSTLMYCDGPRGEQEAWFLALLSSSPTVSVDGDTLVMTGATSTAIFRRG
jgi:heat shock protein HslJ